MIANVCNLDIGDFIITLGDAHLYNNHLEQVEQQIQRKPKELPTLKLKKRNEIGDFTYSDIKIINYESYPHISGKVSV